MKKAFTILVMVTMLLCAICVMAQEKVVVIPLGSSNSNVPGNLKTVSVSSVSAVKIGGTAELTGGISNSCGYDGQYLDLGLFSFSGETLVTSIQFPDGAVVTSFTGVGCHRNMDGGEMDFYLVRSDGLKMAGVSFIYSLETEPSVKTDNSIISPIVDNTKYSYWVEWKYSKQQFESVGRDMYAISAHVTLE